MAATGGSGFAPYVPRLVREWLDDDGGGSRHRQLPGSMVFVDVSGFTAMSERLARYGKVGAEIVTDVIGTCFDALLSCAYTYEGTLLKFGGDALLVFFRGPDHERRAAAAALGMRRTLHEVRVFHTIAGKVTLGMTVGVHSGAFDFFLVGRSHRELVVAGPAASEVVRLEGSARKGQVLASPETAKHLPAANRAPLAGRDDAVQLRGSIPGAGPSGVRFHDVALDLAPYVPAGLRGRLASESSMAEHRSVTIAFLGFSGLDALVAGAPLDATRALEQLVGRVQDAVDGRGVCFLGTDVDGDGGKIILTAGAPTATGADDEQVLLALTEVLAPGLLLPVRVGVNRGPVFAGDIGTVFRRTYTVMGDAVNLAARLMAKAPVNGVVASLPVIAGSRTIFATERMAPFTVKGKKAPIDAVVVGEPRGDRSELVAAELPLAGRTQELARLGAAFAAVGGGAATAVELVGEAGSGKSRLLAEFLRSIPGARVLRAPSRLYQVTSAYSAVGAVLREVLELAELDDAAALERLRDVVGGLDPDLLPWLSLLAAPIGLSMPPSPEVEALDDAFRKRRLEVSVARLLELVLPTPTVLVFDDAQWIDEASAALVAALAAGAGQQPWLVLVSRRPGGPVVLPPDLPATRIDLGPLDPDAAIALVDGATGDRPLPRHVAAELTRRSDGNPLYLLELLAALRAGAALDDLPGSVEALVTARIDRLAEGDRALLRHVSVLGATFHPDHVAAVWPHDEPTRLESLQRLSAFLEERDDGQVGFRQLLVRDVAYSGLSFRLRSRLHGSVAASITKAAGDRVDEVAALLSVHCFAGELYADAWEHATTAGDAARSVYANVEAARLYERALAAGRHLDLSPSSVALAWESLGDVQDLAGLYAAAERSYAAGRRLLADDPPAAARLELKSAFVAERTGAYPTAIRRIRRGLARLGDVADGDGARLRAELSGWYAAIRVMQGRFGEAERWAREAAERAEAVGDRSTLARALMIIDYSSSGGGAGSGVHTARALAIYTELDDLAGQAAASNILGALAYFAGRWDDAVELYATSRGARLRIGDPDQAALVEANIAEVLLDQGYVAEAEALLRSVLTVSRAAGASRDVGLTLRLLGVAASRTGRHTEAAALFDTARRQFLDIGAPHEATGVEVNVAEDLVLQGRGAEALAGVDRLLAAAPSQAGIVRLRGLARIQSGDRDAGYADLTRAASLAHDQGDIYQRALALDAALAAGLPAEDPGPLFEGLGVIERPRFPLAPAAEALSGR